MTFGERLKQARTDKGLTQPQLAQLAGIEQSYLSKLENDKSVPSAEMFSTILAGLGMDEATFLKDVGDDALATTLRHIPAVARFSNDVAAAQAGDTRRWLYGSALAWIVGFALMLAANDGIFFSNRLYRYQSPGVVRPGEAENIFGKYREILANRMMAKTITPEEMAKEVEAFQTNRDRPAVVEWPASRGTTYVEAVEGGHRRYDLVHTEIQQASGNRILQYVGAIVLFSGFVGLFIEWRLRRMKTRRR
ncbi:helix-turn-helix domain-containing protein [uncultured Massilia sp.]|uniref:helix-turn-helix domain-containing protein n=1 Tax=uncultured Massilia sp. TaxID=169973 RepID=UPI0025F008D7|nr:helix-turn-helix transcriptional regulator [uncultured Massilia sp.]